MNKLLLTALLVLCPYLAMGQSNKKTTRKAPLIGISCSHPGRSSSTQMTYTESVIQAGGTPILISITTDSLVLTDIANRLDGIILIGGGDIHPSYFNESPIEQLGEVDSLRDVYDMALIRLATRRNIPMFGICRGEQLINVAFGGTLYQDIPTQHPDTTVCHQQQEPSSIPTHTVHLTPGSAMASITGQTQLFTNTHHHQAVKQVAPGFSVTGWSSDSIPEAIESSHEYPIWGVQFHPEALATAGDSISARFFYFLVQKAATYRHAKEIHRRILSLDTHTDTPLDFDVSYNIGTREKTQVCLPKMREGKLDGQYLACWVRQGPCDEENSLKAIDRVDELIRHIYRQVEMNGEQCAIARTPDDLSRLKTEGKKAFYIGIENGYGISKDLKNITRFHDAGVTYITLCHTRNNDICDSSSDTTARWNGLSPYGRKVVKEMNRLGIMIDLSHAAESTFWWLPLPILQNTILIAVNQPLADFCFVTQNQRGTKTGQNHGKIKSRTLRPKYPLWNTSVSFAKVQICPLKNEGKSLFLSFTTHFPTIVPQMWLLQTVLTSNSMTCENRVLNFVLHSDGHFQKRELAIEPNICHPYCPIFGFVIV